MNPIKNTTLLDAVAMAIQYEKDCFDFYLKNFESSKVMELIYSDVILVHIINLNSSLRLTKWIFDLLSK